MLFLSLLAENACTEQAFRLPHNSKFYDVSSDIPGIGPAPETLTPVESEFRRNRLHFTFSSPPRDIASGYIFGSDPNICDVVLGSRQQYVSGRHFTITFDARGRLTLRDHSRNGTAVEFCGWSERNGGGSEVQTKELKTNFTWILFDDLRKTVSLALSGLRFRVDIADHSREVRTYRARLDQYLCSAKVAVLEVEFHALNERQLTAVPTRSTSSQAQTSLYFQDAILGEGISGIVTRVRDVTTGKVYARKKFFNHRGTKEIDPWRETQILKSCNHINIVKYKAFFSNERETCLFMEYVQFGSLQQQQKLRPLGDEEVIRVLKQGLCALDYLHQQGFGHRDVKPENIFVQTRSPLHIKLGDFGFTKDSAFGEMDTYVGTKLYLAPEVLRHEKYTCKVDIWSLGVVVLELHCDLPEELEASDLADCWQRQIRQWAESRKNCNVFVQFLTRYMLRIAPSSRGTATECLQHAVELDVLADAPSGETTEVMSESEEEKAILVAREVFPPGGKSTRRSQHNECSMSGSTTMKRGREIETEANAEGRHKKPRHSQ